MDYLQDLFEVMQGDNPLQSIFGDLTEDEQKRLDEILENMLEGVPDFEAELKKLGVELIEEWDNSGYIEPGHVEYYQTSDGKLIYIGTIPGILIIYDYMGDGEQEVNFDEETKDDSINALSWIKERLKEDAEKNIGAYI